MTRRFKPLGTAPDRTKAPELSARDKLSSSFIKALEKDWKEHGVAIIEQIRRENPVKYGELIARLVPMEINPPASPYPEAKSTRDVARLALEQSGVPEWLISDDMVERVHAAHQHLADELDAIRAQVEN
jgi:hypothetical protein